jgi:hypothetical protein
MRVSGLLVTQDFAAACALHAALGFRSVETDDQDCVGFEAGETGVILATPAFAQRCWGVRALTEVAGRFVPYVFLEDIGDGPAGEVLADVRTWFGTHERVVRTVAGPLVLAEVAK